MATAKADHFSPDHPWWQEFQKYHMERSQGWHKSRLSWSDIESPAEMELDIYCNNETNPRESSIPWTHCPECDGLFMAKSDYLCWRCRDAGV